MLQIFLALYSIRVIFCLMISLLSDKYDLEETFMVNNATQALIFILMPFYIPYLFWRVIDSKFKE